jgi:hypothetical protein
MGAAKSRGTYEERKAAALKYVEDKKTERILRIKKIYEQECEAFEMMDEEQIAMSEERHEYYQRKKNESRMFLASMMGMVGGIGGRY